MAFKKDVPEWLAEGAEPPASIKESGFTAGYKPPAAYFNWFWHSVSECLKELQNMSPYDIGAVDAMMGLLNGKEYTFDTALKQGEYNVQAVDAAGAPYAGSLYGKLIVTVSDGKEKTDSNWIWQEYLPASASKQRCWRMKINDGDWTNWFVLYDTGHKPSLSDLGAAAENHKHPHVINIGYDRTDIESGADLNNVLVMGCYRCSTDTKASTLLNCPTKYAFILDMVASTGGNSAINPNGYTYGTQRIYALGGRAYVRQVTSNGDGTITYGDWIKMYSTLDKPTAEEVGASPKGHGHNVSDLTGVLPATNGGTGVTSIAALSKLIDSKVATGTYTGTGTQKVTLTLPFPAKYVIVSTIGGKVPDSICFISEHTIVTIIQDNYGEATDSGATEIHRDNTQKATISGNSVSWGYGTNTAYPERRANQYGQEYHYIAFG